MYVMYKEGKGCIRHFYFVIFTLCLVQVSSSIARPLVPRKWIPILPRRTQKYAPLFPVSPLVFTWTYAWGNERGTRDSSGFRLSSITRLDVSLLYQYQFPEIRLALGIIPPREFPSRHRRSVPADPSFFLSTPHIYPEFLFSLSFLSLPPSYLRPRVRFVLNYFIGYITSLFFVWP